MYSLLWLHGLRWLTEVFRIMAEKIPNMRPRPRDGKARPLSEDDETPAMRLRLQHLEAELDRLKQSIDEHFARLNAHSATRDRNRL